MLQFYNTISRQKEKFEPITPGKVKLYTCGPTVYNFAHIGNYRAYIFEDVLHRYLEFKGLQLKHVMNITDVDDKIIAKASKENVSLQEVTKPYIDAFFKNLDDLNIERATEYPRATEYVDEMVEIVEKLIEKGHAYEKDGSYYFDIKTFPEYGRLAHLDHDGLQAGVRIEADEYEKENVRDFALWKAAKEGEHSWDSSLGKGRPGWHLECSAMSLNILGNTFDIHCGGVDNIFPHHENEIAQSEAATGEQFVNYWLHCEHLIVDGKKMSKSLGNQYTLQDLVDKGYDLRAMRYLLISAQYRKRLNFTFDGLNGAEASIRRLDEFILRLNEETYKEGSSEEAAKAIAQCRNDFEAGMDDDLNISPALAAIFNLVKDINTLADEKKLLAEDAKSSLTLLKELDTVLGVMKFEADELNDDEIASLIELRNKARASRNFAESDRIRDELQNKGITLQDTAEGTRWRKS